MRTIHWLLSPIAICAGLLLGIQAQAQENPFCEIARALDPNTDCSSPGPSRLYSIHIPVNGERSIFVSNAAPSGPLTDTEVQLNSVLRFDSIPLTANSAELEIALVAVFDENGDPFPTFGSNNPVGRLVLFSTPENRECNPTDTSCIPRNVGRVEIEGIPISHAGFSYFAFIGLSGPIENATFPADGETRSMQFVYRPSAQYIAISPQRERKVKFVSGPLALLVRDSEGSFSPTASEQIWTNSVTVKQIVPTRISVRMPSGLYERNPLTGRTVYYGGRNYLTTLQVPQGRIGSSLRLNLCEVDNTPLPGSPPPRYRTLRTLTTVSRIPSAEFQASFRFPNDRFYSTVVLCAESAALTGQSGVFDIRRSASLPASARTSAKKKSKKKKKRGRGR